MPEFDLDCLDDLQAAQEEGIDVPIFRPGTQDALFTIGVKGPDSAQQKRAQIRAQEEAESRGALTPLTPEEVVEVNARYLARCCFCWTAKDKQGEPIPFSEDNAFDLLKRYVVIRAAVDAAAGSRARFIKRSPHGSAAPSETA